MIERSLVSDLPKRPKMNLSVTTVNTFVMRALAVLLLFPSMLIVAEPTTHVCDVVIAGGSLASAAAALSASAASISTRVCFLEITDWPGGQATAGGDPAMDFGLQYLNFPRNIRSRWPSY